MKQLIAAWMVIGLFLAQSALADEARNLEPIPSYYTHTDFLWTTPGADGSSLGGYINPAVYGLLPGFENQSFWSDRGAKLTSQPRWGMFLGMPHVGFGLVHHRQHLIADDGQRRKISITDYRLALAAGEASWAMGLGYGWSGGYPDDYRRDDLLQSGLIVRPLPHLSLGLSGDFAVRRSHRRGIFDLALRPLGTPLLTLFADAELFDRDQLDDASWGAGGEVELLPGIALGGKYRDDESFMLGLSISFGSSTLTACPHWDGQGERSHAIYGTRGGYHTDNIFDRYLKKDQRYFSLPLKGLVSYRKYRYFDADTHTLADIVSHLQATIDDPRVAGVALDLSGAQLSRVMAWEIREKLREVREAGKKVVIFFDRAGMTEYHLASAADHIVMDPEGILILLGYRQGNTYYRGMLEKLGLGVDVLRFYTYKSAGEMLARDDMSEADREQRQALVDDNYELLRQEVCLSRNIPLQRFDQWIDDGFLFYAPEALAQGLVDTLGRWSDAEEIIKSLEGRKKKLVGPGGLAANEFPSRTWGDRPRLAVVYGLGFCAMDWGIKARQLEKIFRRLEKDSRVKAVVFRVDSPGGDGMASDVVSSALKRCAQKKPVIVSQGGVAASGGYHISMYADTIVAAPTTVTGSIGVLGLWAWNQGLGAKLGMTTDHVKRGQHADLDFGVWLPILGIELPDRPLSVEERARFEKIVRDSYDLFITHVAEGRGMSKEEVDAVAQGRVWSGLDGKDAGLVDEIGGLDRAMQIARQAAGIGPREEIEVVEMPSKGLFKLKLGSPGILSFDVEEDPTWQYLKLFSQHPGQPLPVLPPELYDDE